MNLFNFLSHWPKFRREFEPAVFAQQELQKRKVLVKSYDVISSTSDIAKKEALDVDADCVVYIARAQTKGRGRGDHRWLNGRVGSQLFSTWSFAVPGSPQLVTSPIVGLAIFNALKSVFPTEKWALKAPNDLYLKDKKIGGILVETVSMGARCRLLVGLGLNVWDYPREVSEAGCIRNTKSLNRKNYCAFISRVYEELCEARLASLAPHLTESQRQSLLLALNAKADLKSKYESVSPFGDLITQSDRKTWREL